MDSNKGNAVGGNLLIGITGAVGALGMPHYIHTFKKELGVSVRAVMTESAQRFITSYAIELFTRTPVHCDAFEAKGETRVPHIELVRWADAFLIIPATANTISKAAYGICDDLLSTAILASTVPTIFAPSMNQSMYENPMMQENLARLASHGFEIVSPIKGFEVADTKDTFGVVARPETIVDLLRNTLTKFEENHGS